MVVVVVVVVVAGVVVVVVENTQWAQPLYSSHIRRTLSFHLPSPLEWDA